MHSARENTRLSQKKTTSNKTFRSAAESLCSYRFIHPITACNARSAPLNMRGMLTIKPFGQLHPNASRLSKKTACLAPPSTRRPIEERFGETCCLDQTPRRRQLVAPKQPDNASPVESTLNGWTKEQTTAPKPQRDAMPRPQGGASDDRGRATGHDRDRDSVDDSQCWLPPRP